MSSTTPIQYEAFFHLLNYPPSEDQDASLEIQALAVSCYHETAVKGHVVEMWQRLLSNEMPAMSANSKAGVDYFNVITNWTNTFKMVTGTDWLSFMNDNVAGNDTAGTDVVASPNLEDSSHQQKDATARVINTAPKPPLPPSTGVKRKPVDENHQTPHKTPRKQLFVPNTTNSSVLSDVTTNTALTRSSIKAQLRSGAFVEADTHGDVESALKSINSCEEEERKHELVKQEKKQQHEFAMKALQSGVSIDKILGAGLHTTKASAPPAAKAATTAATTAATEAAAATVPGDSEDNPIGIGLEPYDRNWLVGFGTVITNTGYPSSDQLKGVVSLRAPHCIGCFKNIGKSANKVMKAYQSKYYGCSCDNGVKVRVLRAYPCKDEGDNLYVKYWVQSKLDHPPPNY